MGISATFLMGKLSSLPLTLKDFLFPGFSF
jgi:hypothetical protein